MTTVDLFDRQTMAHWTGRTRKKWVVTLEAGRSSARKSEVKYVAARDEAGAKRVALDETFLERAKVTAVRLATPEDLGCVPAPQKATA